MTAAALFSDAEHIVALIIGSDDVPARSLVPADRPTEFYRVIRTGGIHMARLVDRAQVAVESWAADIDRAHDLAQLARQAMHAAVGEVVDGVTIYQVEELSGPGRLPDPVSDQPRYTQTFTVMLRGQSVAGS